ncbi:MAG: class I SAM-dependent methyltransferase [Bacillota bacterium]|nr:class I SAM-dependent methyltransferase [Bacillota bacterium]
MNTTELFTGKTDNYVKFRPAYPAEFIQYLFKEAGMSKDSIVADIGAGTGILTKLLCGKVNKIYAVEPNEEMRTACINNCSGENGFEAVNGTAEATTLADGSVQFITVAQAFHWFDRIKCKVEFQRILKPNGNVILVWNSRNKDDDLTKENDLLFRRLCPEYKGFSGGCEQDPQAYGDFFKDGICEYRVFDNPLEYTLEAFIGRALSASYTPGVNDDSFKDFIKGLTGIFNKYSRDGKVTVYYKTYSYKGKI